MKKLKLWLVLAMSLVCLTACSSQPVQSPIILEEEPLEEPSVSTESIQDNLDDTTASEPEEEEERDDRIPPEEGMVRSKLTNEWVDADVASKRPIAVMTPNEKRAVPHYNLSKASVIYEALVEGNMTRMMALYEDWEDLDKIGNVRSLRTYYAYWSFEWDAFLVHFGGPYYINDLLAQSTTQNFNGNTSESGFFRSTDRKAPHNAYAIGEDLVKRAEKNNYSLTYRGLADENHFQFTNKSEPNTLEQYSTSARNATHIDLSECYPTTNPYFDYNEEDGLYYRSQHLSGAEDGPHIDAVTGEQLAFKNVIIQNIYMEDLGDGYKVMKCHDSGKSGWYFTEGKGIRITWEKTSDYGATRYYDMNGDEIVLNTGKTMICVIEDGDTFSYR
ncbi:MAG: DUF3048 domain-containing protein [Lachnospiraceae bacterium]|nr:DUF3048 domain-containing protein [Lachnospiraceae bacterium]